MMLMTDNIFNGSVKLEFEMDGQCKKIEARLKDVECVFHVGNDVSIVAGVYSGIEGHIT
jgi:hypothetical protein